MYSFLFLTHLLLRWIERAVALEQWRRGTKARQGKGVTVHSLQLSAEPASVRGCLLHQFSGEAITHQYLTSQPPQRGAGLLSLQGLMWSENAAAKSQQWFDWLFSWASWLPSTCWSRLQNKLFFSISKKALYLLAPTLPLSLLSLHPTATSPLARTRAWASQPVSLLSLTLPTVSSVKEMGVIL